jgi:hypothetical protein
MLERDGHRLLLDITGPEMARPIIVERLCVRSGADLVRLVRPSVTNAGTWESGRRVPQLIRRARPDHSGSRSANFCTLPVEVFGSARNSIASGHL